MILNTCRLNLICDPPVKTHPGKVRGFIGRRFQDNLLLHNHIGNKKYLYVYPRVQYKTINGNIIIIGIEEGIDGVYFLEKKLDYLALGGKRYIIRKKHINHITKQFQTSTELIDYKFIDPWLSFNSKNYIKMKKLSEEEKGKKFSKILIGNILSMAKSFDYVVSDKLLTKLSLKRVCHKISLNGNRMEGFIGTFSVNFEIPDYWGIGKSVSRGFGTVKRIKEPKS